MAPSATATSNGTETTSLSFKSFKNSINGELVDTDDHRTGTNPATRENPANVPISTEQDIDITGAALGDHMEVLEVLLAAGADVNARGSYFNGYTALAAATEAGNVRNVKRLLEACADMNITSGNKHWNALQIASFHGHAEVVTLLQDAGAQAQIRIR